MSRSIALLSGKGGSGKTTFALALANMLSSCKIKVLLVDCDLITNGATYFYEDRLSGDNPVASFFDLLYSKAKMVYAPMEIVPSYYYFIPSIRTISNTITESHPFDQQIKQEFKELYSKWKSEYDVILFDCSAGYSDVLPYIVPEVDINLVILEPDKVSMAAMRSLYLKLGPVLQKTKFYQIFNKVRPEEVKEYQRREGAFFTSIGAIGFDWSIRDVFAVANVPTLDNAGIEFGMQLSNICSTLFEGDTYQQKLTKFGLKLALRKAEDEREETIENLSEYKSDDRKKTKRLLMSWSSYILAIAGLIISFAFTNHLRIDATSTEKLLPEIIASVALALLATVSYFEYFTSNRERRLKLKAYEEILDTQKERIVKLEKMIGEKG